MAKSSNHPERRKRRANFRTTVARTDGCLQSPRDSEYKCDDGLEDG